MCTGFWIHLWKNNTKFCYKISFNSGFTTKYLNFRYVISAVTGLVSDVCWKANSHVHRARKVLTRKTPDFITTILWPANSPDLNPVGYEGSCRSMCTTAGFMTSPSWSHVWSKSGNISRRWSTDHGWSSQALPVFKHAFQHVEDILNRLKLCLNLQYNSHVSKHCQ